MNQMNYKYKYHPPIPVQDALSPLLTSFMKDGHFRSQKIGRLRYAMAHPGSPVYIRYQAGSNNPSWKDIEDALTYHQPGSNTFYLGFLSQRKLHIVNHVPERHLALVLSFLQNVFQYPVEHMRRIGRATGECQMCHHPLTNDVSKEVGFGPVCAARVGLEMEYKLTAKKLQLDKEHEEFNRD